MITVIMVMNMRIIDINSLFGNEHNPIIRKGAGNRMASSTETITARFSFSIIEEMAAKRKRRIKKPPMLINIIFKKQKITIYVTNQCLEFRVPKLPKVKVSHQIFTKTAKNSLVYHLFSSVSLSNLINFRHLLL